MKLTPISNPEDATQARTRQQLLHVAAEVFAEVGFRSATVREICQRAGANIAAVHYHFGDKEKLYLAVLEYTKELAMKKYPLDFGLKPNATPEERLRAFVQSFLLRIFDEGPIARHGKLMAREMIEPTGALDTLVEEKIRPQANQLNAIVSDLLGRSASKELVRLCGCSVVSQCLFYHHCGPVVRQLFPEQKFDARGIEGLVNHITTFSLAAIQELAQRHRRKN